MSKFIFVTGGVAANNELRKTFERESAKAGFPVYFPSRPLSTDNAAMIAVAGLARLSAGQHDGLAINARAQWPLSKLSPCNALRATFSAGCAKPQPAKFSGAARQKNQLDD